MNVLDRVEKLSMKEEVASFRVGDTVDVHVRIKEGDKERVQIFNGVVIGRRGSGTRETFTVRRIVAGEGVERVFPVHSPFIVDVVVKRPGKVRRAKLYYLRDRVGKATKVKERRGQMPTPEEIQKHRAERAALKRQKRTEKAARAQEAREEKARKQAARAEKVARSKAKKQAQKGKPAPAEAKSE